MKKVFWKKLITLLLAFFSIVMLIVAIFGIGFHNKSTGGIVRLPDLIKGNYQDIDFALISYGLMLSGLVISVLGLIIIFISTLFGRLFLFLDRILWTIGLIFLTISFLLTMGGEVWFANNFHGIETFKETFNQSIFAGMLICTILPSLLTISMGIFSYSRKAKK